jgi:hypothetical protein
MTIPRLEILIRVFVIVAAGVPSGLAYAETKFPTWDMQAFCSGRVPRPAIADCVELQNEARDRIRSDWPMLDAVGA